MKMIDFLKSPLPGDVTVGEAMRLMETELSTETGQRVRITAYARENHECGFYEASKISLERFRVLAENDCARVSLNVGDEGGVLELA